MAIYILLHNNENLDSNNKVSVHNYCHAVYSNLILILCNLIYSNMYGVEQGSSINQFSGFHLVLLLFLNVTLYLKSLIRFYFLSKKIVFNFTFY